MCQALYQEQGSKVERDVDPSPSSLLSNLSPFYLSAKFPPVSSKLPPLHAKLPTVFPLSTRMLQNVAHSQSVHFLGPPPPFNLL